MTTPVFMDQEDGSSEGRMGFVIPRKVAEARIPQPANEQVHLTKRRGGQFAVIRFSGRINQKIIADQQRKLESWIEEQGLKVTGEAEVAGYDPPWTPGLFRRNEILIRIR
jgi:hypothetical protein